MSHRGQARRRNPGRCRILAARVAIAVCVIAIGVLILLPEVWR